MRTFILFLKWIVIVVAENPLRDKINISSCESTNGQPEMTIVGPDFILNGKYSNIEQNERIIEKKVNQEDLIMKTNKECELKIL